MNTLRRAALLFAVVAAVSTGCSLSEKASGTVCASPEEPFIRQAWALDDTVESIAVHCDTIYVAGSFESIGVRTGPLATVSRGTGEAAPGARFYASDEAAVDAIVTDHHGGWYVGGWFDGAGDAGCPNLIHLLTKGRVDPSFCPRPDAPVHALALHGGTLYVGGTFNKVGSHARQGLAAVDARTGKLRDWAPAVGPAVGCDRGTCGASDGRIYAIAVDAVAVYVGGRFGAIDGVRRSHIAALDARSGAVLPFDAHLGHDPHRFDVVRALALFPGGLLVGCPERCRADGSGGGFLRLDAQSGDVSGTQTKVDGGVAAIFVDDAAVYLGGAFRTVDGKSRAQLAALATTSGRLLPWNPESLAADPELTPSVDALARVGDVVYAGGFFGALENAVAFDARSGARLPWAPRPNDAVYALGADERHVVIGGSMSAVNAVARDGLAAIDGPSGRLLDWAPRTGDEPWEVPAELLVAGERLYVGGSFERIDGELRRGLAAFDLVTHTLTPWSPSVSPVADPYGGGVVALAASDDTLFAGGRFTYAGDASGMQSRLGAAAFDLDSGELADWDPKIGGDPIPRIPVGSVVALAADGDAVYAGGKFEEVAGSPRAGVVALDGDSGDASSWDPAPDDYTWVEAIQPAEGGVFLGGWFGDVGGAHRVALALVDAENGRATGFDANLEPGSSIHGPVYAIALDVETLFVAGSFERVGAESRPGLAAFEAGTGRLLGWQLDDDDRACSPSALAVAGGAIVADGYLRGCGNYESGNAEQVVVVPLER